MEYFNDNQELDFDGFLENDEPELLPEGDYNGIVIKIERGRYNGGQVIPPCAKITVTIRLDTEDGPRELDTILFLHKKAEKYLSAFFRAIGQKKRGERIRMDWTKVPGSRLRVHVGVRTTKPENGEARKYNNIAGYLDYDPAFFPADPQWLQEAMAMDASEPLDEVF